ncbi:MAG: hypothetical protein OQL19_10600 [Gammaproteobacteria bacterium]|nr:hypothetical protein [Gammaproteobacteria bacterium]
MSGDISPLSPISSTPLVREKRHYPGDQKENKQEQSDQTDDDAQSKEESEVDSQQKPMNNDKKNGKVGHIDEYA